MAAFHEVYATARDRAVRDIPRPGTLSIGQLARIFASDQPGSPLLRPGEYAAMQGLMLSASETEDTRALAEGLLARAGQTSMHLLRALRSPRGEIGRLDAQILSLTCTQLVTLDVAGQLPASADGDRVDLAHNLLVALFD